MCRPGELFYYGFANWALASQRTHIVWHNPVYNKTLDHDLKLGPKDWQHIWLSPAEIDLLLDKAFALWRQPLSQRPATTLYLNSPGDPEEAYKQTLV